MVELRDRGHAVELVDGEIVHKAAPKPEHGDAQVTLGALLYPFKRRGGGPPGGPTGWWIMSEVEVAYSKSNEIFRHDLVGFRRERLPERPTGIPVEQRADWVCEILSPSTARYDVVQKQRSLHLHGVPHYWLVNPEHETLAVLRHGADAYVNVMNAGVGDVVRAEPFDAIEIDIAELFGRAA
ncbi:MAG TPA: Uma2 family endonuclease [Sandaracinaceae bacterium LLY-WYZ-13_1]|nr:Uma2 family endonuclease [Sandaracinaceae bacterium LLY-WYZ-13_1]